MSLYCWADSYRVLCVAVAVIPECSTTGAGTISMEKTDLALPQRGWCCLCTFALPKSSVATTQCCCVLNSCLGQPESGHQERSYSSFNGISDQKDVVPLHSILSNAFVCVYRWFKHSGKALSGLLISQLILVAVSCLRGGVQTNAHWEKQLI